MIAAAVRLAHDLASCEHAHPMALGERLHYCGACGGLQLSDGQWLRNGAQAVALSIVRSWRKHAAAASDGAQS
jgi:hypothetical protein